MSYKEFAVLRGETVIAINGIEVGSDEVTFETASGRQFRMYHEQECCEGVSLNEVIGNPDDLIGTPITMAEESSNSDEPKPDVYSDSWTWTFYKLATVNGYVTLRWLGESNGYYSESVSFVELA